MKSGFGCVCEKDGAKDYLKDERKNKEESITYVMYQFFNRKSQNKKKESTAQKWFSSKFDKIFKY